MRQSLVAKLDCQETELFDCTKPIWLGLLRMGASRFRLVGFQCSETSPLTKNAKKVYDS